MIENRILEENNTNNNTQNEDNKEIQTKYNQNPVVYSSLLSKLRQNVKQINHETEQNKETNTLNNNEQRPKVRGFKNSNKKQNLDQKQNLDKKQNLDQKQNEPRLSTEEYLYELKKCQKAFFVELSDYLKEEILIKQKTDDDKKKEITTIKKTNLDKILDGQSVNIIKIVTNRYQSKITDKNKNDDLKYLDNLITNRQMNFVKTLSNYMDKYEVLTTFRGKNNIILHSQYLMV